MYYKRVLLGKDMLLFPVMVQNYSYDQNYPGLNNFAFK
jgi:hypothetical protein